MPGGGSPDPGVAEPGSLEPATPGLGPDGADPGIYPDSGAEGSEMGGGSGWDDEEGMWGQQPPPSEGNPWAPDDLGSQGPPNQGWGGGNSGGNSGGGGGGGGSGSGGGWGDWGDWGDLVKGSPSVTL